MLFNAHHRHVSATLLVQVLLYAACGLHQWLLSTWSLVCLACRRKPLWDGWGPGHWWPHYPVHGGTPRGGLHQPGAEAGSPTSGIHTEEERSPNEVSGYWTGPTEGKCRYVNYHLVIWFYLRYQALVIYSLDLLWHALHDSPLGPSLYMYVYVYTPQYVCLVVYIYIHFSLRRLHVSCLEGYVSQQVHYICTYTVQKIVLPSLCFELIELETVYCWLVFCSMQDAYIPLSPCVHIVYIIICRSWASKCCQVEGLQSKFETAAVGPRQGERIGRLSRHWWCKILLLHRDIYLHGWQSLQCVDALFLCGIAQWSHAVLRSPLMMGSLPRTQIHG